MKTQMNWLVKIKDLNKMVLRALLPIIALLFLAIVYLPVIQSGAIVNRDDTLYLDPLKEIRSVPEFSAYLVSSKNPDPAPVRDISLMIDILLERSLSARTFHLQNLFWWFLAIGLMGILFQRFGRSWYWALLFAFHPIAVMSVGWISARKHLMALVFILAAINLSWKWLTQKKEENRVFDWSLLAILIFYLLSVFSQLIHIFFPFWLVFVVVLHRKKLSATEAVFITLLCGLCIYLIYFEHHFYLERYKNSSDRIGHLDLSFFNSSGDSLLALGRYFWNALVPWRYSVLYSAASIQNILGIPLGGILIAVLYYRLGFRILLTWGSLALLSLTLVILKNKSIFVSDSYALLFALIIFFMMVLVVPEKSRWRWAAAPILILFLFRSQVEAKQWVSSLALWKKSYQEEPECVSATNYALQAIIHSVNREEIFKPLRFSLEHRCVSSVSSDLSIFAVYFDSNLAKAEMIEILNNSNNSFAKLLAIALENSESAVEKWIKRYKETKDLFQDLSLAQLVILNQSLGPLCENRVKQQPEFCAPFVRALNLARQREW